MEKVCFKCHLPKPLTEFYRHVQMADGYLNKCKECARVDARAQGRKPHVIAATAQYNAIYRVLNRKRARANSAVAHALRAGRLVRQLCMVCGCAKTVAHHPDYDCPLDVVWLCQLHHREAHTAHRSGTIARERVR